MREHEPVIETGEQSIGAAVQEIIRDVSDLIRSEFRLAMLEVRSAVTSAALGSGLLLVGGALAFLGLMFLLLALAAGLATTMSFWLAALIVGVLVLALAAIFALIGYYRLSSIDFSLETTRETVQENVEWLRKR